jgi:hypothetical protein
MKETENTLQMIIDGTNHQLMDETENILQIIIDRTEGGRGRARQDHLVSANCQRLSPVLNDYQSEYPSPGEKPESA